MFNDDTTGFNVVALGLNTGVTNPFLFGAPRLNISGFDNTGLTPPLGRIDTTGHLNEVMTYIVGTHTIRFGGEYQHQSTIIYGDRQRNYYLNGAMGFAG